MILAELFDKPVPFKIITNDANSESGTLLYRFVINDSEYEAEFYRSNSSYPWEFAFALLDNTGGSHDKMNVTGTGNEITVFATAIQILIDAINKTNAYKFRFTADTKEESRVKLYDRFIRMKLAKNFDIKRKAWADEVEYFFTRRE